MIPLETVDPNGAEALDRPVVSPLGFREYDARWRYPDQINLAGMTAVGMGIGTQLRRRGLQPEIVVGNDLRAYSPAVKNALILGLIRAGVRVQDIGTCLTPTATIAQVAVAVVEKASVSLSASQPALAAAISAAVGPVATALSPEAVAALDTAVSAVNSGSYAGVTDTLSSAVSASAN
jgi:phosphomannomutase